MLSAIRVDKSRVGSHDRQVGFSCTAGVGEVMSGRGPCVSQQSARCPLAPGVVWWCREQCACAHILMHAEDGAEPEVRLGRQAHVWKNIMAKLDLCWKLSRETHFLSTQRTSFSISSIWQLYKDHQEPQCGKVQVSDLKIMLLQFHLLRIYTTEWAIQWREKAY